MQKFLAVALASCGLLALQVSAQYGSNAYRDRDGRYYDRDHRDYHEWNDREARAWHRYWQEQHRREIAWERAKERQRRDYWRWRHEHPDY